MIQMNEASFSASIPMEAELREGKPDDGLLLTYKPTFNSSVVQEHGRAFLELLAKYDAGSSGRGAYTKDNFQSFVPLTVLYHIIKSNFEVWPREYPLDGRQRDERTLDNSFVTSSNQQGT